MEQIETGNIDANWATLRAIARALHLPMNALIKAAEVYAPGLGGEEWRRHTREAEKQSDG